MSQRPWEKGVPCENNNFKGRMKKTKKQNT